MTTTKNNIPEIDNSRRDNEDVKERIAVVLTNEKNALEQALELLKQAEKILQVRHSNVDSTIYQRTVSAVWKARYEAQRSLEFSDFNDCYLGNKACGPLGAAVLKDIANGIPAS
jgi:hypothetical protein